MMSPWKIIIHGHEGWLNFYQGFRLAAVTENFVLTYSACTVLSEPHSQLMLQARRETGEQKNKCIEKWVLLSTMLV